MSKYASLPDLDTAPDVYETPDVADNYETEPAPPPNENIDTSAIPTSTAAERFKNSDFDNSLTFYSNRIDRQQVSFSSGVAGESRDEKLARIKLELQELADSAETADKADVDQLSVMLEGLAVKRTKLNLLHVTKDKETSHVTKEPHTSHVTTTPDHVTALVNLEARLSKVESSLYDPNSPSPNPTPLASEIRDLMLKLSLLTSSPQTLQAQQNRIQGVKNGVKRSVASRGESRMESRAESRLESRDNDISLQQPDNTAIVYSHMATITYLSHVVPKLLLRLKTLKEVHSLASVSVVTMATVNEQIKQLEDAVAKWTEVLERVEQKVEEGGKRMEKNMEFLGKK